MRIALFTDTFLPTLNGVARTLGLLIEHANRHGHEVGLVTPHIDDDPWPGTAFHIKLPGLTLPFYKELKAARPYLSSEHRQILEDFQPDLVHSAVEAIVGMLGRQWALKQGVPFVSSYCTNFPDYMSGYHMGFLEGSVWSQLRWFHGGARTTLVPSHATLRELQEKGFHDRMRIWGRGVDGELFNPARRDLELRESMAPGAEVVLMYVGRIAPEKKVDLLMEAFPRIRDRTSRKVALVFVGGGPALERLQAQGVDGVYFAGYQRGEELAAHYASGDVFLFPSDTETFGQVVTEAMSSGLSVVAPRRGGVQDTVRPGETGLLFNPGDVDDLVEKGLRLVENDGLRAHLAAGALEEARSRSWTAVFEKLFADYADVADGGSDSVTEQPPKGHIPSTTF